MEEIPPALYLYIVELKYKFDVLYRIIVCFLPVLLPHVFLVEVLENTEPSAHGRAY